MDHSFRWMIKAYRVSQKYPKMPKNTEKCPKYIVFLLITPLLIFFLQLLPLNHHDNNLSQAMMWWGHLENAGCPKNAQKQSIFDWTLKFGTICRILLLHNQFFLIWFDVFQKNLIILLILSLQSFWCTGCPKNDKILFLVQMTIYLHLFSNIAFQLSWHKSHASFYVTLPFGAFGMSQTCGSRPFLDKTLAFGQKL